MNKLLTLSLVFIISSCEWLAFQDTADMNDQGLWKLKEIIAPDGKITTLTQNDSSVYFYRHWYGLTRTNPQFRIDSIFMLKNSNKEVYYKVAVKEVLKSNKKSNRNDYSLYDGKYIYVELEYDKKNKKNYMYVSDFVEDYSMINQSNRYKYKVSEEPYP